MITYPEFVGPISNVFNIQNPHERPCHVLNYTRSHGELCIGVIIEDSENPPLNKEICQFFLGVQYFEGSMWWKGASLKLASVEERSTFSSKIDPVKIETKCLFTLEGNPNATIKILAAAGGYLNEVP